MSDTEDRLRAALAARAEQIGPASLRPVPPPGRAGITRPGGADIARPGARSSGGGGAGGWHRPALVLAMAAVVVAIAVLGGVTRFHGEPSAVRLGVGSGPADSAAPVSSSTRAVGAAAGLSSSGPAAGPCRAQSLALAVLAESPWREHSGGMNHHGLTLSVVNVGQVPCRITGYLGIGMYDGAGRQVSAGTVTRGGSQYAHDAGPRPLLLAPGAAAFADLAWSSATGRTPEVAVTELGVIPPGDTVQLRTTLQAVLGADGQVQETALSDVPAPLLG